MQHVIHGIQLFHNYFVGVAWHLETLETIVVMEYPCCCYFVIISFCGFGL